MIITTKLPSKELSPNARLHWSKKIKYKNGDKAAGWWNTREVIGTAKPFSATDKILMHLEFYYPTKAKRDDDNVIASFKAIRDGIAEALKIDDKNFTIAHPVKILHDKENPRTVVTLELA